MPQPQSETQEPRDQNVTVRVSASEKRAVQLIALLEDTTESEIMRSRTMPEIVSEAERRRQQPAAVSA